MSTTTTATWLAKLQAEPWYQGVQHAFSSRGIADPLWQATLLSEDASLDPTQSVMDHYADGSPAGYSTGLFQLNANGVGAGQSAATLTDPIANATLAATKMAKQIASEGTGSASLPAQLQSIERAGWNGGTTQDLARQANLSAVLAASLPSTTAGSSGGISLGTWQWWPGSDTLGGQAIGAATSAASDASQSVFAPVISAAQEIALAVAIGGVFLALIAGGFAVAASPSSLSVSAVSALPGG